MGDYCYTIDEIMNHGRGMRINPCPFYDRNPYAEGQSFGYCHHLRCGDYQRNGTSLLFDQVKECGLNDGDEEYE